MNRSKVIFFDVDGTVVDSLTQKLPSHRLVQVVKHLKKQFFLCAATGRCLAHVKNILSALEIEDLCILSGGSKIYDPSSMSIEWQQNMSLGDLQQVQKVLLRYSNTRLIFNEYSEDDYFYGGTKSQGIDLSQEISWLSVNFLLPAQARDLVDKLQLIEGVKSSLVVSQKKGLNDVHIVNAMATKGHAAQYVLTKLGLDSSQAIGVGDGHNDLHLFDVVGYKVAMGNAVPELKDKANLVIERVEHDGLAKYFESLVDL